MVRGECVRRWAFGLMESCRQKLRMIVVLLDTMHWLDPSSCNSKKTIQIDLTIS